MAFQTLDLGIAADDGTGDSLRVGGDKINDNFLELYTALGDGDGVSSGISASATVITLVAPIIAEIDNSASITLDAGQDIILDAGGADIFLKDDGTTYGSLTNSSGNLIIKSGTTTAATFSGANVTLAGTLGVGAITTTGAFKGADGYTIGNASVADVMTLAASGIVTFKDDILIKDGGTIGVASATTAMTISSAGIVTFVDDILIKDAGTIGSATTAAAITIEADGDIVLSDDLYISGGLIDLKNEGSVSQLKFYCESSNAHAQTLQSAPHSLASSAVCVLPTLSGTLIGDGDTGTLPIVAIDIDGGTDIGEALVDADLLVVDNGAGGTNRKTAVSRIKTYVADVTLTTAAQTNITSLGTLTTLTVDNIIINGTNIGHTSDTDAIAIGSGGVVNFTQSPTVASAAVKFAGKESIWVPAGAMYPSSTNGCADLTQVETTALRPDLKCLDFDASSDEFAQFSVAFPKSWNEGTVTFQPFWTVTGTNTGTVAWQLGGIAASSDDSINTAFGTLVATTALAHSGTSNDLMVSVESGNVTIGGSPAAADCCFFQINRDISADNQSGDARLLGVKLFFTTDAANDA